MKIATLLIVLLSQDGYWFGDRAGEIRFETVPQAPAGRVEWELHYGAALLKKDVANVAPGKAVTISVTPPAVRTRSALRLTYRFTDAAGKELEKGESSIRLFPDDLFAGVAATAQDKLIGVWGSEDDALAAFLTRAQVPHVAATGTELRLSRPDIVLFGAGSIDAVAGLVARPPLEELARNGATVIVFRQAVAERVNGYQLVPRTVPTKLEWRSDHTLLAVMSAEDLASLAPANSPQTAVRLPVDEPALELAWWPAEVASDRPAPIDALLVTKTIGRGRLVLCQLPLGDWVTEPRGQMFLRAALEYASTPPGPTPPPSERAKPAAQEPPADTRDILNLRGK